MNTTAVSHRSIIFAALTLAASSSLLMAGPINPPAGPVGSTLKTLGEIEPRIAINSTNTPGDADSMFSITQSGSYYLSGNITGVNGKDGIKIFANDVTIDLNGFTLSGGGGSHSGIRVSSGEIVSIRNGSVRNWGVDGIDLSSAGSSRITDLNTGWNAANGIQAGSNSIISKCTARFNGGHGITVLEGCVISGCAAVNNQAGGIMSQDACTITECSAAFSTGYGIQVEDGCTITNCTSENNTNDGIRANNYNTIKGNSLQSNGDDGIQVYMGCQVTHNTCGGNGPSAAGAGVYAANSANRIEENHLTNNSYGVLAGGTDNFIVKNTARGNSTLNFSAPAGNEMAPVITNPGSNGFATMTPWSNVAY